LLRLAAELRDLPSEDVKTPLKANLERRASMATKRTVHPVREGFHTITPYLTVHESAELIDFTKGAFGAEELLRSTGLAGGIHCEVKIGDSIVMIGEGGEWRGTPMPAAIHLYVEDADAVYRRALAAGATSLAEPVDQFYGDREASVKDLSGNHWYIATNKATGHAPQGLRTVTPYLHPRGADQLIDFLERSLGAEEVARHWAPDGTVADAKLRIGDSVLEIGEAHGPWQPMPSVFFLYVEDVDAWYRRAVEAGAPSLSRPSEQPYGDRVASVTDPSGNVWYIATHVRDVQL
jgi:uncharacterized glyoxalase superfamily protein PhnB